MLRIRTRLTRVDDNGYASGFELADHFRRQLQQFRLSRPGNSYNQISRVFTTRLVSNDAISKEAKCSLSLSNIPSLVFGIRLIATVLLADRLDPPVWFECGALEDFHDELR